MVYSKEELVIGEIYTINKDGETYIVRLESLLDAPFEAIHGSGTVYGHPWVAYTGFYGNEISHIATNEERVGAGVTDSKVFR